VWNTPIPADAPIATHSASYVADLNNLMTPAGLGGRGGNWAMDHRSNSTRVYFPPQNTPRVPVLTMFFSSWDQEFNSNPLGDPWERLHYVMRTQGVPLIDRPPGVPDDEAYEDPTGALGMQSCEGNADWPLDIILPNGEQWNLWACWRGDWKRPNGTYSQTHDPTYTWTFGDPRQGDRPWEYTFPGAHGGQGRYWVNQGTWRAWHGAYIPNHLTFKDSLRDIPGSVEFGSDPFYQSIRWGNRATGIPTPYGVVLQDDIAANDIDHALGFAMGDPTAGHTWPAVRDDGYSGYGVIKQGAIFRIKANVPEQPWGDGTTGYGSYWDNLVSMMIRCIKRYGMICVDKTGFGGGIAFTCDANALVDWDPGSGGNPPYSLDVLRAGMPPFTSANWEVISPAYRPPGFFEGEEEEPPGAVNAAHWGTLA
jgi:hypothetical protein